MVIKPTGRLGRMAPAKVTAPPWVRTTVEVTSGSRMSFTTSAGFPMYRTRPRTVPSCRLTFRPVPTNCCAIERSFQEFVLRYAGYTATQLSHHRRYTVETRRFTRDDVAAPWRQAPSRARRAGSDSGPRSWDLYPC